MTIIDDEFRKAVGNRLRESREKKGLTEIAAAEQMKISAKTVGRHERAEGKRPPNIVDLINYAEIYNTTLDYILCGKETSDDDSFTRYDVYKRLNRLWYSMCIELIRNPENPTERYLKLVDSEAIEWFDAIERFENHKKHMFNSREGDKVTDIHDVDALFEEFKMDNTKIYTMRERDIDERRWLAAFVATPSHAEYRVEDNNDSRDYILRVNKTKSDDKQ